MKREKRYETPIYLGVVGNPVRHSLSPRMHNRVMRELGIKGVYLAFEVKEDEFQDAVKGAKSLGFVGLNITLPFKEMAYKISDVPSEDVEKTGSANTLLFKNGKIFSFNTDIYGFEKMIEEKLEIEIYGKKVAIIGAGGVSRTIIYSLMRKGAEFVGLFNRSMERARNLKEEFGRKVKSQTKVEVFPLQEIKFDDFDIIINATSVGWKGENLFDVIGKNPDCNDKKIFVDTIYIETEFIRKATEFGHIAIDGKWMFVLQGAKSFEIWTGIYPPEDVMLSAISEKSPIIAEIG